MSRYSADIFKTGYLAINASESGFQGCLPRLCDPPYLIATDLPHTEGESSKQPRRDATTSVEVGSKASFGASFRRHLATVDEKITGEIHSRDGNRSGRKEGRKEETKKN